MRSHWCVEAELTRAQSRLSMLYAELSAESVYVDEWCIRVISERSWRVQVKRQLTVLLPGVRIFLDVDDLQSIDELEAEIEASVSILVMLGTRHIAMRRRRRGGRTGTARVCV